MQHTTRRRLLKGIGAGSTVGIAGLAGCSGDGGDGGGDGGDGGGDGGDGGDGGSTGTPGGSGPSSFHVGVFSAFSGPFADWGPALELGATLAAEDIESEAGVDVQISTYDTETNPNAASDRIQRAVTADNIDFAFGGISSAVCSTIGSWTSDNGVVYIADGASGTLTGADCQPFMFRTYSSNNMMSRAAAPAMADIADSWYIMYADYVWGQNAQEIIGGLLQENGASVAGKDATPWPPTSRDYTQYLNNAANSDADGLALVMPGAEPAQAMSQARNEGILGNFEVMVHQNEDPTYWGLGKWAAEALSVAPTGWANTVEGGEEFKQQVADRGNLDPFVRHVTAYTGMDQLLRASIRAGSKSAEDVRDALEGHEITDSRVNDIESGNLYWRECDHQLIKPTYIVSGMAQGDMVDSPYKQWFQVDKTVAGDDVARTCEETGCSF